MTVTSRLRTLVDQIQQNRIQIQYAPTFQQPEERAVLMGFGDFAASSVSLCLNHKRAKHRSLSEWMYRAEEEEVNGWRERLVDGPESWKYVVEDLSPDTCVGFLLFYCRVHRIDLLPVSEDWLDYVNRWERGDVKTTGRPFVSWGCLHSSLAHSYFDRSESQETAIQEGFKACMIFLLALLHRGVQPDSVPELPLAEYIRAHGFLSREYQEYLQALGHAELVQVRVPIRDSKHSLLVDAFIAKEKAYLGASKAFLRNDTKHTYFESGFSLMALHRPEAVGTGNDMVISVDPNAGIYLKDLWAKLEELENAKWQGKRPTDRPRFPDVSDANQPWFHEMGRYTIVAAPKAMEGIPGSRISWKEVTDALWELYHPAAPIRVKPYEASGAVSEQARPIHECTPLHSDIVTGKRLIAMKWDEDGESSLLMTPTLQRYLAACIAKGDSGRLPHMDELPPRNSFDSVELSGGFAIVHSDGVLLLDDWSKEELSVSGLKQEYLSLVRRFMKIEQVKAEISNEMTVLQSKLEQGVVLKGRMLLRLTHRLTEMKLDLRRTLLQTMPSDSDYFLMQFRQAVETRWAMNSQLEELYEAVGELENIMQNHSETRTGYLINAITVYGFPWALTAGLFGFIFTDRIHWVGLGGFIALSLAVSMLIKLLDKRSSS